MSNYFIMPDSRSFETKENLAAYYGISAVELGELEDKDSVIKRACELVAEVRGYTVESLEKQELKRTMLMLLAGNATIENEGSFEPRFDISNKYIAKAMKFIGMIVDVEYSWDALSKIEADICYETMLIKVGLGVELDYYEKIALDALQTKADEKKSIDFLEEEELYGTNTGVDKDN